MSSLFDDESDEFSEESVEINGDADNGRSSSEKNWNRLADEMFVHGLLQYRSESAKDRVDQRLSRALVAIDREMKSVQDPVVQVPVKRRIWLIAISSGLAASVLGMFFFFGSHPASAGLVNLDKIIEASRGKLDQTYRILVANEYDPVRPPRQKSSADRHGESSTSTAQRPPKPSLNDAILHVRDGNQFVLIRQDTDGKPFVTGSDGRTSWAVRSEGPVRVSSDLNRFNRDLPGHENAIPLTNIYVSLQHLRQAYEVRLGSSEAVSHASSSGDELHTIIATKKPKERGPERVEIEFDSRSGQIQHMRFIEMPYGPARLDLTLTRIEAKPLSAEFFHHQSHHSPDRIVEIEE